MRGKGRRGTPWLSPVAIEGRGGAGRGERGGEGRRGTISVSHCRRGAGRGGMGRRGTPWLSPIAAESPDKPGTPMVADSDKTFIKLKWDTPASDGGAPIKGYYVEKKDLRTGRWVRLNKSPVKVRALVTSADKILC